MQDRLQGRYGPLVASVMVAPAFVLFHLPLAFLEAPRITLTVVQLAVVQLAVQAAVVVFLRVAIAWLYNGSGGSVLIAALFHTSFNTAGTGSEYATGFIRELVPGPAALLIPLAVVAVIATVVAVLTGGRLAYEPGRAAATRPADAEGAVDQPWRHDDASEPPGRGAHVQEHGDRD